MNLFSGLAGLALILLIAGACFGSYKLAAVKYQAEMDAIRAANDRAIASAEKDLREDVALANAEKEKLENDLQALEQAALASPDADKCGMSLDGVLRHKTIE